MNSYVIRRITSVTLFHKTETEETYNHQHGLYEGDLATPASEARKELLTRHRKSILRTRRRSSRSSQSPRVEVSSGTGVEPLESADLRDVMSRLYGVGH